VEPPKVERRLKPDGSGPVSGAHVDGLFVGVTSVRSWVGRAGGHDEVLRGSRGEAAGEELGTHPVKRFVVNVGTVTTAPASLVTRGQAHRQPMLWWWGGAAVVVRDRESRSHGQGRQRVRSAGAGRSGGRR
jgi:hypothetical protein